MKFRILDNEELLYRQQEAISQVTDLLCTTSGEATRILRYYKWSVPVRCASLRSLRSCCWQGQPSAASLLLLLLPPQLTLLVGAGTWRGYRTSGLATLTACAARLD